MKKFHFPLERVREWREKQVALEEARLERMEGERRAIEVRILELEREKTANEAMVLGADETGAVMLRALDEYRRFVRLRQATLTGERAAADKRIAEQRTRIMEAQRKVRLLDKLKARKRKLWNAAFDHELEEQAAEAFLAKWNA